MAVFLRKPSTVSRPGMDNISDSFWESPNSLKDSIISQPTIVYLSVHNLLVLS